MHHSDGNYQVENRVSVWVGTFPDQQVFDRYMEEVWPEEESRPVRCPFWNDLGVEWNDSDLQEAHFEVEAVDIATLLSCGLSFVESYAPAVKQSCQERGIHRANAVVLIFDYAYPMEANFHSSYLNYVGVFPFR